MVAKTESEVLKRLVLDETETLESLDQMVSLAEKLFKLNPKDRSVVLTEAARRNLTTKEKASVYLVAQYFGARKVRLADGNPFSESEALSLRDLAEVLNKATTAISGRLTELVREGIAGKDANGGYFIQHHQIQTVLSNLVSKVGTAKP